MTRTLSPLPLVLLLALASACADSGLSRAPAARGSAAPATAAPALPEVAVAHPSRESLRSTIEAPGTFVAYEEAAVAAEGAGVAATVHVEEGSRVRQGDVLVQLDPTKARLSVRQAEAALAQARAAFDKARSDLARKQQLLDDRTIAAGTFDSFKAQHDASAAAVDAAESGLELARRHLQDLTITAPLAGIVKEKRVTVGEYVREGEDLVVIMRVDPIKLQFDLPERYAGRLKEGDSVRASVAAFPGEPFTGTVRTIFPALAVQSRTVRVEAQVPNRGQRLKPGFYAAVEAPVASAAGSFVVPRSAVVRREGVENVFIVRGAEAVLVPVQTGAMTADKVEVVSGLGGAEPVVVEGAQTLEPGDRVRVRG